MAEPTRRPSKVPPPRRPEGAVRPEPTRTDSEGRHVRPQGPARVQAPSAARRDYAAVDDSIDIGDRDHGSIRHTEPPPHREEPDRSME